MQRSKGESSGTGKLTSSDNGITHIHNRIDDPSSNMRQFDDIISPLPGIESFQPFRFSNVRGFKFCQETAPRNKWSINRVELVFFVCVGGELAGL